MVVGRAGTRRPAPGPMNAPARHRLQPQDSHLASPPFPIFYSTASHMAIETTATFKDLLQTRANQYPPPGPASGSGRQLHQRKASTDVHPVGGWVDGRQTASDSSRPKRTEDVFLKEAYQIVRLASGTGLLPCLGTSMLISYRGRALAAQPPRDVPLAAGGHPAPVPGPAGLVDRQRQGARAAPLRRQSTRRV
jgi:hypothetical protein